MSILIHTPEMTPSEKGVITGGVQNPLLRLTKELYSRNIATEILTNDRKFSDIGIETKNFSFNYSRTNIFRINAKYPNVLFSLEYLLKTVKKSKEIAKEKSIKIIHGHSGHLELSLVTKLMSASTNLPAVHTIYCPVRPNNKKIKLLSNYLNCIDEFICVSENVQDSLYSIGIKEEKIKVIPPIIDFDIYKPGVGDRNEIRYISKNDFVMMYLGNLTKTKQMDTIIEALKILKEKGYEFKLLSGLNLGHTENSERTRNYKRKVKEYNLNDNIIELGLIDHVEKFMDISDLVVVPFENTYTVADYPITILEAMAVGTPVISSSVGGIPEIITDNKNGILIEPNNPKMLAKKIIDLKINTEKREYLGNNAMNDIRKKLDTNKIINKTIEVYDNLLA